MTKAALIAEAGVDGFATTARPAKDGYQVTVVERAGCPCHRAHTSTFEKLRRLPGIWRRAILSGHSRPPQRHSEHGAF